GQREKLERTIADAEWRLAAVDAQLGRAAAPSTRAVIVRALPAEVAATASATVTSSAAIAELFDRVEAHVASHGARANGPPFAILPPLNGNEGMPVGVGVPLRDAVPASDGRPAVATRSFPAVERVACTVHVGPYTDLPAVGRGLIGWLDQVGLSPTGP